jgi:hypothetical protein
MAEERNFYFDEDTTDDCLDKEEPRYGKDRRKLSPMTAEERKAAGLPPPFKIPPLSEG